MLPSDTEEAELTETELDDQESVAPSNTTSGELSDEDMEDEEEAYSDEYEDDWEPPTKTPKAKQPHSYIPAGPSAGRLQLKGRSQAVPKSSTNKLRAAKLTEQMNALDISEKGVNDTVIPSKKTQKPLNADDDDELDLPIVKKKKRSVILQIVSTFYTNIVKFYSQLGKNPVITEEAINEIVYAVEKSVAETQDRGGIRRFLLK